MTRKGEIQAEIARMQAELRRQLDRVTWALEHLLERGIAPPDRNCSCHISPPCNDCVEWSGLREAVEHAESALAAVREPVSQHVPGEQHRVETDTHIIVLGKPPEEPDDWPEDDSRRHNCDVMGCGRAHVLARIRKPPISHAKDVCEYCNGTGDVHNAAGEWRGACSCADSIGKER